MLAQCVMAEGVAKHFPGIVKPVVEFCLKHDLNIMQMPCPEAMCASGGLGRLPHGKSWYEANGLREISTRIANDQARYIESLIRAGIEVLGVIGIEFSPACAVNYLNRGRSIVKGEGIYVEELRRELSERGISIPFVGVSARWSKKLQRDLNALIACKPDLSLSEASEQ